jgi:hypothetical protein
MSSAAPAAAPTTAAPGLGWPTDDTAWTPAPGLGWPAGPEAPETDPTRSTEEHA